MKKLICLSLLLAVISPGLAQKPEQKSAVKTPLQAMVDTELAFAKMSAEQGIRPSFMAFIADEGILFRPRAVKGKSWMTEHPVPQSDKRPLLSWYPSVADIAIAGDIGYTTGPWEFKPDIHDAKPVAFGNFLTVWKRQADGSWKFAIDLGISNPQPDQIAAPWQGPNYYRPMQGGGIGPGVKENATGLLAREREFSDASTRLGARQAFVAFAAKEVRVYREDKQPLGKADAESLLLLHPVDWTWEPAFADVSRSGDLGYTYGTYRLTSKDSSPQTMETGNYFRIWKKQGSKWLVVADLTNPVPEDRKN